MEKSKKDPLKPKEDVRIEDKETGFLNTLKKMVSTPHDEDAKCPEHGLIGKWIPPSKLIDTTLLVTYRCPKGHDFTKLVDTLKP